MNKRNVVLCAAATLLAAVACHAAIVPLSPEQAAGAYGSGGCMKCEFQGGDWCDDMSPLGPSVSLCEPVNDPYSGFSWCHQPNGEACGLVPGGGRVRHDACKMGGTGTCQWSQDQNACMYYFWYECKQETVVPKCTCIEGDLEREGIVWRCSLK